jgi:hypothetical protein
MTKAKFDVDDIGKTFFTGELEKTKPKPESATPPAKRDGKKARQKTTAKNDGKERRQSVPSKSDGKISRQNMTVENDGNDSSQAGRVHAKEGQRRRVELRIDAQLADLLTAEAAAVGISTNEAMNQILKLYFDGREGV